uniref:Uncharacterized protein n=1 Tax=Anguilla anguilla TaxID=7936 RepID=A0A0E9QH64_ANGAN
MNFEVSVQVLFSFFFFYLINLLFYFMF